MNISQDQQQQVVPVVQYSPGKGKARVVTATGELVDGLVVRAISPEDVGAAMRLSQAVQWSSCERQWRLLLDVSGGLAVTDPDGEVVAMVVTNRFENSLTIGKMMVDPDYQRRGLGSAVLQRVMAGHPGASMALNATASGIPLYRAHGFVSKGWIVGMAGPPFAYEPPRDTSTRVAEAGDRAQIRDLDAEAMGYERTALVDAVLDDADRVAVAVDEQGKVVGYATRWFNGRHHIIGPLVAGEAAVGAALVAFCSETADADCRIDVPDSDVATTEILADRGWVEVHRIARMTRGVLPSAVGDARQIGQYSHATT